MLKISGFTAGYRKDYPIIQDVNLSLEKAERIAITGRNGAGKSTFAKAIMKLTPFVSGEITYNDVDIIQLPAYQYVKQGIAYFIQDGVVFPNLSVKENLEIAVKGSNANSLQNIIDRLSSLIINVDQHNFLKQKGGNLSGGERNLLALSMVLVSRPSLLLLDEPFAGISPNNIKMITEFLNDYINDTSCSLILIDQNQNVMEELCTRVLILRDKKLVSAY